MNGFDFAAARVNMVERQLRSRGIRDERVLAAMSRIPREDFLPAEIAQEAYQDCALPIDCEQTISQPMIVALMSQALDLSGKERVLEVGTGSGYQTAILAELAADVCSIERHNDLARQAEDRLRKLGYRNVAIRIGDGSLGWPEKAPFDRIIITAAARECPPALWDQLGEGGILVGPFGSASLQDLCVMRRLAGQRKVNILTGCRFVPLVLS